jgi:hypothetical protein
MAYKFITSRKFESEVCPGVVAHLFKMTEGRRSDLRAALAEVASRERDLFQELQALSQVAEDVRDMAKWVGLNTKLDALQLDEIQPTWIQWGLKSLEGLVSENDIPLTKDDWKKWPSALFKEIYRAIQVEAELDGAERKNSESPTTSGVVADGPPSSSTAASAEKKASGEDATAGSSLLN